MLGASRTNCDTSRSPSPGCVAVDSEGLIGKIDELTGSLTVRVITSQGEASGFKPALASPRPYTRHAVPVCPRSSPVVCVDRAACQESELLLLHDPLSMLAFFTSSSSSLLASHSFVGLAVLAVLQNSLFALCSPPISKQEL